MLLINASNAGWVRKAMSGSFCNRKKNLFWSLVRDWRGRKCQEKDLTGFAQWGAKKGWSKNLLSSLSKEIETSPSALETPDKKSETPLYLFSSHTWIFLCFLPASHLTRSLQRRPAQHRRERSHTGAPRTSQSFKLPGNLVFLTFQAPQKTSKVQGVTWMILKSKDQEIPVSLIQRHYQCTQHCQYWHFHALSGRRQLSTTQCEGCRDIQQTFINKKPLSLHFKKVILFWFLPCFCLILSHLQGMYSISQLIFHMK